MAGVRAQDRLTNQIAAQNVGAEATAVSGMLALPLDYPPVRVADTYSANKTATAQAVTKSKITWDSGVTPVANNGRQLPLTDWGAFIFPSLLRHQVIYTILGPQATTLNWRYQAARNCNGTALNLNIQTDQGPFDIMPGAYVALDTIQPHGPLLFCGQGAGRVGVWVDAMNDVPTNNASVTVAFNLTLGVQTNAELTTYQWNAGRWLFYNKVLVGNAAAVQTNITTSGYYAFTLAVLNPEQEVAPTSYTLIISMHCSTSWAHHYVNHMLINIQNVGRARILGTSFLLQNEASVMNKQGNCVAMQIPAGYDWYNGFAGNGLGFYNTLFDDDNSQTFLLETGMYGFKRPKGSQDFDWEAEIDNISVPQGVNTTGGTISFTGKAYFALDCPCDYLAVAASANQLGAGDCLLSTAVGIEYTTQNSWLDTATPAISESAFKLGIATLREVDQFMENPIHIPSIMSAIADGMRTMAPIVGLFPGIGPALSGGLLTGGQIVTGVRDALYGGGQDVEQGGNATMKKAREAKKRQLNVEEVVANGNMVRAPRQIRVRRR